MASNLASDFHPEDPVMAAYTSTSTLASVQPQQSTLEAVRKHKQREHLAELANIGAGAFALYEAHQAKKDPAHVQRHRSEAITAGVTAVGMGGYAIYEHHEVHKLQVPLGDPKKHEKKHSRDKKN